MNNNSESSISKGNEQESNQQIAAENQSDNSDTAPPVLAAPVVESFSSILTDEVLLKRLAGLGLEKPFPVQGAAIPPALEGRDLVIQAKTGSGKTLAFVLPLIKKLSEYLTSHPARETYSLFIVPTRELAVQISDVVKSLSDYQPVTVIGGESIENQSQAIREEPFIVIGTPGRLLDLIRKKALKLHHCRYFVLDEADEMLSMGFLEDVRAILSRLPDKRQGVFVSATITPRVEMLASSFLSKPQNVFVDSLEDSGSTTEHFFCEVGGDLLAKPAVLCDIIETQRPRSCIIFCNTKSDTQLVEVLLRRRGFDARRINSDLTQAQRTRIMNRIRKQELQFLVATDIAARGIDISEIELVVNFSIHEQPEIYVHRTGRTGRAGALGRAISLVGPKDFGYFHYLTKVLDITFQKLPAPTDQEVCDARLAHLYEIVREAQIEPKERDVILGRKLLEELGEVVNPPEELEMMVSKLSRFVIEHNMQIEAMALDEEDRDEDRTDAMSLQREPRQNREERGGPRGRREEGGYREGGHREEGRREEGRRAEGPRDRGREGQRRDDRRGDNRQRGDHRRDDRRREGGREDGNRERPPGGNYQQRGEGRQNEGRQGDGRQRDDRFGGGRGRNERGPRHPRGRDDRGNEREEGKDFRLYIGQGHMQGMTAELFSDLADEFAGIKRDDLKHLSIREHYGFVDLDEQKAKHLIANLNGIEYNGMVLPVEFATEIRQPQRRGRDEVRESS